MPLPADLKAKLAADLTSLIDARSTVPIEGKRRTQSFNHGDLGVRLIDDEADLFEAVIAKLLSQKAWNLKFSEEYLEEAAQRLLVTLFREIGKTTAAEQLDILSAELDQFDKVRTVYLPLSGVVLDHAPLEIGRVQLFLMDSVEYAVLSERFTSTFDTDGEVAAGRLGYHPRLQSRECWYGLEARHASSTAHWSYPPRHRPRRPRCLRRRTFLSTSCR